MPSRRVFLTRALVAAVLFPSLTTACKEGKTDQAGSRIKSATAVAVEFDRDIDTAQLSTSTFKVDGRTIVKVYANTTATTADKGTNGKYAIVELSPDDRNAALYAKVYAATGQTAIQRAGQASVTQTGAVTTIDGNTYPPNTKEIVTSQVVNSIVDDFQQFEYQDPKTGEMLTMCFLM
jgi:predicted peptidase